MGIRHIGKYISHLEIEDHPDKGYVEIEGVRYSYCIFRRLASPFTRHLDFAFKVVEKEDGALHLQASEV